MVWAQEIIPVYQKVMKEAVRTGRTTIPVKYQEQLQGGFWYYSAIAIYLYSFFDVYWLFQKNTGSSSAQPTD